MHTEQAPAEVPSHQDRPARIGQKQHSCVEKWRFGSSRRGLPAEQRARATLAQCCSGCAVACHKGLRTSSSTVALRIMQPLPMDT